MVDLKKYQNDYILFLEAGFIAINQMDEQSAIALFKAAELLNPKNAMPTVGLGYLHLCKFELKQAAKLFEEAIAKDNSNEMAKAFLGIALSLNPLEMSKGEKLLTETAMQSKDPAIKQLAGDTIVFVDTHLKKAISNYQSPRKS